MGQRDSKLKEQRELIFHQIRLLINGLPPDIGIASHRDWIVFPFFRYSLYQ